MYSARGEVFRTGSAYFGALAAYCRAQRCGADLEAPTQEVVGRSLLYMCALKQLSGSPDSERRVRTVIQQLHALNGQYALHHRHDALRAPPAAH